LDGIDSRQFADFHLLDGAVLFGFICDPQMAVQVITWDTATALQQRCQTYNASVTPSCASNLPNFRLSFG